MIDEKDYCRFHFQTPHSSHAWKYSNIQRKRLFDKIKTLLNFYLRWMNNCLSWPSRTPWWKGVHLPQPAHACRSHGRSGFCSQGRDAAAADESIATVDKHELLQQVRHIDENTFLRNDPKVTPGRGLTDCVFDTSVFRNFSVFFLRLLLRFARAVTSARAKNTTKHSGIHKTRQHHDKNSWNKTKTEKSREE